MEIMGLVSLLVIDMDYLGVFAWLVISSPLILRGGFPFLKHYCCYDLWPHCEFLTYL